MKSKQFTVALACALLLAALSMLCGCQKQQAAAPANQNNQPAQASDQGNGAAPGAPHVDPSKSPIADPASPLYGWEKFSSTNGKFSAIYPSHPKEDDKTENGKTQVQMHLFISEAESHSSYGACYYDLSRVDDPKMVLARLEDGMVKSHKGKIASYKPIQFGNLSGTEFEFTFGDMPDYSSKVRLISDGLRVYVILAVFHPSNPNSDERDAFFNSFTLQN